MKDYLISSYIDDELDLDEKIEFVETVHEQVAFKEDTVDSCTRKSWFAAM